MAPPEFRRAYYTAIPLCRTACQVISERIEIDSVHTGEDKSDKFLAGFLKNIGGSEFVNTAIMVAMEYGRSYLIPTGTDDEDGFPGVQIVPGRDMVHSLDPYTGEVAEALRVYGAYRTKRAYYTKDYTQLWESTGAGWTLVENTPTDNGKIAVFPMICRDDVGSPWGRPEAKDIFTIQDSACRVATDLAIASATLAVPQRAILGLGEEDFTVRNPDGTIAVDGDGEPIHQTGEDLYMSRFLVISNEAAKLAEFTAAQLQNFTTALNFLTKQAAASMGVPQSVFGVSSDANPASGDAMRQDDNRLIRRAEQLTRGFDNPLDDMFEYVLFASGYGDKKVKIAWVDPSLPNLASRADAVSKLAAIVVGNQPLYDWEELRQKLGDSAVDIQAAKDRNEQNQLTQLLTAPPAAPQPVATPPAQQ